MRRTLLALLVAALGSAGAVRAQDVPPRVVHVRVTSVARGSVYLDAGREAGLAPGLEVELLPPDGAPFRATIREVSSSSARAELPPLQPEPPVGTPGEVTVRARADDAERAPRRAAGAPEHPPWELQDFPQGDTTSPLLAPAFGGGPESRPTSLRGRLFGQFLYSRDEGDFDHYDSHRARIGARLDLVNPLGHGGVLGFDGELSRRASDTSGNGEDSDDRARLDRLSYAHGDDAHARWRYEVGRFTSRHAPELGLLDGVELVHRLTHSLSVGGGLGFAPLALPERETGDDFGSFLFAQWRPADATPGLGAFAGTLGFQKTWHRGAPDRDLVFARLDWTPAARLRVDASALVDFYGGSDELKDSSAELTQGWLAANWRATDAFGLGVSASTYRWAQLLREDLAFVPPELVRDGHVERWSPRAWLDLTDRLRLSARADLWRDHARSGEGGELGLDWREVFGSRFDLGLVAYDRSGSVGAGPGARITVARSFEQGSLRARFEWTRWSSDELLSGPMDFDERRIGLDADFGLGIGRSLLLSGDWIRSDGHEAWIVGIYAQQRF